MMCRNWKHKMHLSYLLNCLNIIYNSNVIPCPQETCPQVTNTHTNQINQSMCPMIILANNT